MELTTREESAEVAVETASNVLGVLLAAAVLATRRRAN
jgi:hypothetical protein